MDAGVTASVSAIIQELPLPDQKAQCKIPLALPWGRWMDNSNTQVGALKAESLTGSQRGKESQSQGGAGFVVRTHRANHLRKVTNF